MRNLESAFDTSFENLADISDEHSHSIYSRKLSYTKELILTPEDDDKYVYQMAIRCAYCKITACGLTFQELTRK